MRGFLESEESDFTGWLKKLTVARLESMTSDDRYVSAVWGATEAARAGVTALADASDGAYEGMKALNDVGLRGIVFQESFGPDPRLANDNFAKLTDKVARLAALEFLPPAMTRGHRDRTLKAAWSNPDLFIHL